MSAATPAELQRLIAATFDSQGWEYDLTIGPRLVEAIRGQGGVDAEQLTRTLPSTFFQRNRVSKDRVAAAIERAIGGRTLREEARVPTTIVIGGNNYQVTLGEGASVVNSNLNVGEGTQITVGANADRDDVLLAVEALVRAGLSGEWNEAAANDLEQVLSERPDIDYEYVQETVAEVVKAVQPPKQRAKDFLGRVAASGLGGVLATGITAGLGEAMTYLPT